MRCSHFRKLPGSIFAVISVVAASLSIPIIAAQPAAADPGPIEQVASSTVTSDALPTTQIDGVAWSQIVIGSNVYVGGSFANARPAGAAPGTNQTPRANLLSYNLGTGALNSSFAPSLNGQARVVAKSPDSSRLYVGGDFTTADGQTRGRIAAYDTATGALIASFAPSFSGRVNAILAVGTTVYVGGDFTKVGGVWRIRLAAVRSTDGALLNWNPNADWMVNGMAITPDGTKIIVGGGFQNVNNSPAYGLAAIDPTTGMQLPWNGANTVKNAGSRASIISLHVFGNYVYGTGYVFGPGGNLEGTFKADANTGDVLWVEDCHGDTYDATVQNDIVYTVSHAHYCGNIGGFFQSDPWGTNMRHALAFTNRVTGTMLHDPYGYFDWSGFNSPSLYNWFPELATGTFTGQSQAAWTITGTNQYILMGGEFPSVNGSAQQGLVRFATRPTASAKQGPSLFGANWVPSAVGLSGGKVRVSWPSNWDKDDLNLTYTVTRNGAVVYTKTSAATFWNRPTMGFVDTGLTAGQTYQYRVQARDGDGNQQSSQVVSVQAPTATAWSAYAQSVLDDSASIYWRLGESSGTTAIDYAGFTDGTVGSGVSRGAAGAIDGDSDTASTFDGSGNGTVATATASAAPNTFSTQAWIRTTTTSGGKIVGFGNTATGQSSGYDRHIYMDNNGRIWFGVYPGSVQTVNSSAAYNDGQWHQVVATLGIGGMELYVDGVRVGRRTDVTSGQDYPGFWRVGGDNLGGWSNQPTSNYFAGAIDEVSIYPKVLSRAEIAQQYTLSGRSVSGATAPSDSYGAAVWNDDPYLYWRLGESNGTIAADTGPNNSPGNYTGGVTMRSAGALNGVPDTAVVLDGSTGGVASQGTFDNPSTYSEELWFNTTTNQGGKLIGFGSNATGNSDHYDRHIWMQNDGTLVFGTYAGGTNTIMSPASYNDGHWHHVVASQGSAGMKLYVDGQVVGVNPQTGAESYTGYWRVGGDVTWFGASSNFFAGAIDEVAVYAKALSDQTVSEHYRFGSGTVPNQPPVAAFTSTVTDLGIAVNGAGSSDPDGSVASYAWDWGDGTANGSGATASHSYAAAGTYPVTLTVTDNRGGTATVRHDITVSAANQLPVAAFTVVKADLRVDVDGSTSSDPDGTIASYKWVWGDGAANGSGATASHSYAAAGTYSVTLTVTDNRGGAKDVSHDVAVTAPAGPVVIAADTFARTTTNGWGTAETGGSWTPAPSGNLSTAAGTGRLRIATAGTGPSANLAGVSAANVDGLLDFTADKVATGGGLYVNLAVRRIGTQEYRAKVRLVADGSVQLILTRLSGTAETTLGSTSVSGVAFAPGTMLRTRFLVRSSSSTTTALSAKIWIAGSAEPAAFQLSRNDSTAGLQGAGSFGIQGYLSSTSTNAPVVVSVDNLSLKQPTP